MRDVRRASPVEVEVDFGAGATTLHPSTNVLDLRPGKQGRVPADGPVRWDALDALPQLLTVLWAGPARGIVEAIAARPGIRFLYWFDAEGHIDLTGTRLGSVRVDGLGLRGIRLPNSVRELVLGRPPAHFDGTPPTATIDGTLHVEAADNGHQLDLRIVHYGADVVIPDGLRRASSLWLSVGGDVSATVLSGLTDLETLRLTFDRAPGAISELTELSRHTRLRSIEFDDAYGLVVAELPELAALQALELHGTRRATAAAVKSRYRGGPVSVCVSGAKTDQWLAVYMDNPFRDWVHESKAFGKAVCEAYNRARQAADAVGTDDPNGASLAQRALHGLVADLNAIDDKYHLIDTILREQAWDAYSDLARQLGVPSSQADSWFDDQRRF